MNFLTVILEILKYTIPAAVVMIGTSVIVRRFLVEETRKKQLAVFQDVQDTTLRLRLQAYERLIIFLERMQPIQLLPRVYETGMTVRDLQHSATFSIISEFEHNLSQQIYTSAAAWAMVRSVKEQTINMINNLGVSLNPDAPARELHARILEYLLKDGTKSPIDIGLELLHDEVSRVMNFGTY
ncbi:MAG: hypothetical protein EBX41_04475 [Chitinophagia bacterium]|nr:hypothetical protein [Chitinophagia bacterium]